MQIINAHSKKKIGELYICCQAFPFGKSIEEFIVDPPVKVKHNFFYNPIVFNKHHILLWVNEIFYPYPSDFIETIKIKGISQKISITFPIEKLNVFSKMYFIHRKAFIKNFTELSMPAFCPKNHEHHLKQKETCIGYSYNIAHANTKHNKRKIADIIYQVYPYKSLNNKKVIYSQGIFLELPITHLSFIISDDCDSLLLERVNYIFSKTNIPVYLEKI